MGSNLGRLYAPFVAVVLVQALLIAVAPSTPPERAQLTAPGFLPEGMDPEDFEALEAMEGFLGFDEGGAPVFAPGSPGAQRGTSRGAAVPGQTTGPAALPEGDTSHCTPDGRQHGITYHAPLCVPKWPDGADNGGATHQGVTREQIKIIGFHLASNEQVDTFLASQGLAQTKEQRDGFNFAAVEFLNKRYELYGREIVYEPFDSTCPTTPPDTQRCLEEARKVIGMRPFMVMLASPLYSAVFDEFARAGIATVGGWHFDARLFNQRRPFRWDFVMEGTKSAQAVAEYYCKKLAGQNATHSGRTIHPTIGNRGQVRRKLGIVGPDDPANIPTFRLVRDLVRECDGQEPPIFTYESDINRAQEQTTATSTGLIQEGVTTVVCMCDPIAPIFGTNGFTQQGYYPEHLVAGMSFMDYDLVGRLYDQSQWQHAFGLSHINEPIPHAQADASKVWRDVGRGGNACGSCGLNWAYFSLMGSMLQNAGPSLNPLTVERGMFASGPRGGWGQTGGRPEIVLIHYGPNNYTGLQDVREVHWRADAVSKVDGRPGAYVSLEGGRRWEVGQLAREFKVPPPRS